MKKWMLALSMTALLAACGDDEAKKDAADKEETQGIEVDKGLLNVDIVLPAEFFEDQEDADIIAEAEKNGAKDVKVNEDGSVSYTLSKSKHKELLKEMEADLVKAGQEMVDSTEYPSIKAIAYNKSFTELDITVDREQFENSFDGFGVFGLIMGSSYYQAFAGQQDDYKLVLNYIDEATGKVYDTANLPEDFEDTEEETEATDDQQ